MNVFKLFGEISIDKTGAIKGIKEVEGQASKSSLAMQKTFNKLAKIAKVAMIAGAVAATAAVVKMTKDSIKAFAEFEEGMNEVFTLLPDITEEAMDKMAEDVKSLAKEMGILPDEIVPALYQAISAGIPAENVFDFMRVASTAAIGGVTDLETAVDGLTSIINAYGRENMTARDAADILFTAVRLGKTTMEELSDRLFQVNPIAAALGVKFEDVAAAMAEITAAGVPTRVAATQLRQMFMELSKAGSDVAVTFEAVAGESFQDFIASGHNVGDALQLLTDYAEENDIKMQDMFGSVEAGQAVLALTGTHLDSYTAKIAEMDNAAGAADAAHAKMEGGLKRTWAKIMAWWATVKINLGEKLQAPLERLMEWLDENREKIEDGIMAIFDKLISAAEWLMDNSDLVAKGLKAIAIAFGLIVAIKFGIWALETISSIYEITRAIGVVGGTGLLGAIGFLGAAFAVTAATILAYNQKIDASAESTSEMANAARDLITLAWSGLHADLLGIATASGITAKDLKILQTEIDKAYEAAMQAPNPKEASKLYAKYVNAILAEYERHYPELLSLRETWIADFEALDEEAAADKITLEEETHAEVLETTQDYLGRTRALTLTEAEFIARTRREAGEEMVVDTEQAQTAITALAEFGMRARKTIMGDEEENIYSLGDAWDEFKVRAKGIFEDHTFQFFRMFHDNAEAAADYEEVIAGINTDQATSLQDLKDDLQLEYDAIEQMYLDETITKEEMEIRKEAADDAYEQSVRDLATETGVQLGNAETFYRDNLTTIEGLITSFVDDAIREIERLAAKWVAENVWGWLTGTDGGGIDLSSLDQVWTWLGTAFGGVATWLGTLGTSIGTAVSNVATFGGGVLETVGAFLGSGGLLPAIGIAAGAFLLVTGRLNPLLEAFGSLTGTLLNAVIPGLGDFVGTLWTGITGFFTGLWDWLFGITGDDGDDEAERAVFKSALNSMLEQIRTVSDTRGLYYSIDELRGRAVELGLTTTAGMIQSAASEAYYRDRAGALSYMEQAIASFARGGLVASPVLSLIGEGPQKEAVLPLSKPVFRELGQGIIEALTGAIMPQPALAMAGGDVYVTIESAIIREEADIDKVAIRIVELTEDERRAQGRDSLIGG